MTEDQLRALAEAAAVLILFALLTVAGGGIGFILYHWVVK